MQNGGDELAFKLLHRLSVTGGAEVAIRAAPRVPYIVAALQRGAMEPDAVLEAMGTLAAVLSAVPVGPASTETNGGASLPAAAPSPTWSTLLVGCDIFDMLAACMSAAIQEDLLLQAINLVGALAGHAPLASQLSESGLVSSRK